MKIYFFILIVLLWSTNPVKLQTGKDQKSCNNSNSLIQSIAFSNDERYMIANWDHDQAKLWDTTTGEVAQTFRGESNFLFSGIPKFIISPDDEFVVSANETEHGWRFLLWSISSGKQTLDVSAQNTGSLLNISLSSDGKSLLISDELGAHVYDMNTGAETHFFQSAMTPEIGPHAEFSSNDKFLLTEGRGDAEINGSNQRVELWDIQAGKKVHTFASAIHGKIASDNSYIITSFNAFTVWSMSTYTLLYSFGEDFQNFEEFSPDGRYILTQSKEGPDVLWDVLKAKTLHKFDSSVAALTFSPDSKNLMLRDTANIDEPVYRIWNIKGGYNQLNLHFAQHINIFRISPNSKYLAVSPIDNELQLFSLQTGKLLRVLCA